MLNKRKKQTDYEVIIIGGGPAGLSAALVLGRCLRSVLVCDNQDYRNKASKHINGFLTQDGISPSTFRNIAENELKKYKTIKYLYTEVVNIHKSKKYFTVTFKNRNKKTCRKVLLATGRKDVLPKIDNIDKFYGKSLFHCPYCDGWECKDKAIAVIGIDDVSEYALGLTQWSKDILYCTNGQPLANKIRNRLIKNKIKINDEPIVKLIGTNGYLKKIKFANSCVAREVIFCDSVSTACKDLIKKLGCKLDKKFTLIHHKQLIRNSDGIYVAGDNSQGIFQVMSSAGEGVQAAIHINKTLNTEDTIR